MRNSLLRFLNVDPYSLLVAASGTASPPHALPQHPHALPQLAFGSRYWVLAEDSDDEEEDDDDDEDDEDEDEVSEVSVRG